MTSSSFMLLWLNLNWFWADFLTENSSFPTLLSSSPTSRSRGSRSSRLGSADALPTDATQSPTFPTELKGRALRAAIQSGLRWRCPGNAVCADCDRAGMSVQYSFFVFLTCEGWISFFFLLWTTFEFFAFDRWYSRNSNSWANDWLKCSPSVVKLALSITVDLPDLHFLM